MEGILIVNVVHVAGTSMIEVVIYGLYRGNYLVGIMRDINQL